MTERELLELAAKAAGIEVWTDVDGNLYTSVQDLLETPWNPLTDDGDAMRLSVTIGMVVNTGEGISTAFVGRHIGCIEPHGSDPYESTRRAIVRAAAEIGKNMK